MFDVARLLGDSLREVKTRDGPYLVQNNIDASANFIIGGQVRGEPPRLFNIYGEGNFIEATPDTCYFQIGETKYGKPIIDRVIKRTTSLLDATKCTMVSFDSTMRSNISVGPADRPAGLRDRHAAHQAAAAHRGDPTRTSRWCTRSGARACGACSRSCPIPTGRDGALMAIRVALSHRTTYRFDRHVSLGPHEIRLRPAPHCRTPVLGYSLNVTPDAALPQLAAGPVRQLGRAPRVPGARRQLEIEVDLVADLTVINPFDFFVEEYAEKYPFAYKPELAKELIPFLETAPLGPRLAAWLDDFRRTIEPGENTVMLLVRLNQLLQRRSAISCAWSPGSSRRTTRWRTRAARAATPAGCSCRSCGTWASPRASRRAT